MSATRFVLATAATLATTPALAHTPVGHTDSFGYNFLHPLLGLDHLLAMVAVGLWAALVEPRLFWVAPSGFMGGMLLGALAGMSVVNPSGLELTIGASVLVFGLLVALEVRAPAAVAFAGAALFGGFHGIGHGSEMPVEVAGAIYAAGFLSANALLHATGIGVGLLSRRLAPSVAGRTMGVLTAVAGAAMLLQS
jgi:urease accessory protein